MLYSAQPAVALFSVRPVVALYSVHPAVALYSALNLYTNETMYVFIYIRTWCIYVQLPYGHTLVLS